MTVGLQPLLCDNVNSVFSINDSHLQVPEGNMFAIVYSALLASIIEILYSKKVLFYVFFVLQRILLVTLIISF